MDYEHSILQIIQDNFKECRFQKQNEKPFTLYCVKDIGHILGIKNMRQNLLCFPKDEILKIKVKTCKGSQTMTHLTLDGVKRCLTKSRKPSAMHFSKLIGFDVNTQNYACIEADTLQCIISSFEGEHFECQYYVKGYLIDLYMPRYNLAIECDENHSSIEKDIKRENDIKLEIGCNFIRYKPYDQGFNIFKLIGVIYKFISLKQCMCEK